MTKTPVLDETDLHLFHQGTHDRLYEKLGAHIGDKDGVSGAYFGVFAPRAESVSVVGDFNGWEPGKTPLPRAGESGVYQGHVPGVMRGSLYKYHIVSRGGAFQAYKTDPLALRLEAPPGTASVVWDLEYDWRDGGWVSRRASCCQPDSPISIYEVHAGSFMRNVEEGRRPLSYSELSPKLVDHVRTMGFTHVGLMPLAEHLASDSWGYETTGHFAATSRYGAPQDLMALIDALHAAGIGVILDFPAVRFSKEPHGLAEIDGAPLFEQSGHDAASRTAVFDTARPEVRSYLISCAMMWIRQYHVDGLRLSHVSPLLSNSHGGEGPTTSQRSASGLVFLRHLNETIKREANDVLTILEEPSSWPMVTSPIADGGLGFDYKWDTGFSRDTIRYLSRPPEERKWHHGDLTFRGLYAFSEKHILPLSHEEVALGVGSLFQKMAGDEWQKLANLRLLFAYMYSQPGKKLLFMGSEFGQRSEWSPGASLDWHLLTDARHRGIELLVGELNRLYREERCLHEVDLSPSGFFWLDPDDAGRSTLVYERVAKDPDDRMLILLNLLPAPQKNKRVGARFHGMWEEVLNTDAKPFGGSGHGNLGELVAVPIPWHGRPFSLSLTLPPLGALFLRRKRSST